MNYGLSQHFIHRAGFVLVLLILCLGSAACSSSSSPTAAISPAVSPPTSPASTTPLASDTPAASPTPQRSLVIFLAPPGSDAGQALVVQGALSDLVAQAGLRFETRTELAGLDLGPDVLILVSLPPDPGLPNLAAANPEVQILAVGVPGLQAGQNLSVVGSSGARPDQQGFLAGYLAALVSPDWRVGVVSRADTVAGKAARNGFINGVVFYCGLCRPAYPPFFQYPLTVDVAPGAGEAEQQAAATALIHSAVKTAYVFPGAGDMTLLELLGQAGVNLIGGAEPPPQLKTNWVASIMEDQVSALREIWPRLLAGEGGISVSVPLVVSNRNAELFSPGRQRLVDGLLEDLSAGYVDPGINLETGEPR